MMMLSQAAAATNGMLIGHDVLFTEISKDTRTIKSGALYVALKGEQFDGHLFLDEASRAGAVAALVSEQQVSDLPQIKVSDTRLALGDLAAGWREKFHGSVIGVTGSNGKTTVKEMCRAILENKYSAEKVMSTQGNLNNDIGLPMTLLSIRERHEFAVIEMGANHLGEINYLTQLTRPDVAVITNAASAHIEGFGSIENVAHAKAEIFDGLSEQGVAVINADDPYCDFWKEKNRGRRVITFSMLSENEDVVAKAVSENSYLLKIKDGEAPFTLNVPGRHNVMNALAAAAATLALGVDVKEIASSLEGYRGMKGRLQFLTMTNGCVIIDDSYNANPYSLHAAMEVLVAMEGESWLLLGDMGELGDKAEILHREAGIAAKKLGVKHLFATGEYSRYAVEGFGQGAVFFDDKKSLALYAQHTNKEKVTMLVKGSRHMKMEDVVSMLMDGVDEVINQLKSTEVKN